MAQVQLYLNNRLTPAAHLHYSLHPYFQGKAYHTLYLTLEDKIYSYVLNKHFYTGNTCQIVWVIKYEKDTVTREGIFTLLKVEKDHEKTQSKLTLRTNKLRTWVS